MSSGRVTPLTLPVELIEAILLYLPLDDYASVLALVRSSSVSRQFSAICQLDSIWKPYLQRWTSTKTPRQADQSAAEYYKQRAKLDIRVANTVKEMATATRTIPLRSMLYDQGMDACDILIELAQRTPAANTMLGIVMRAEAVAVWNEIAKEEVERDDSFERSLIAFSYFKGGLPQRVEKILDEMAAQCTLSTVEDTLEAICEEVMQRISYFGVRAASAADFHSIDNHYINIVLDTAAEQPSRGAGTLPMTLVGIFCSIVRRRGGVIVKPISYPGRMLAMVVRGDERLFIDVFGGRVIDAGEISRLDPRYLVPGSAKDITRRISANIVNSCIQLERERPEGDLSLHMRDRGIARYPAAVAMLALDPQFAASGDGECLQTLISVLFQTGLPDFDYLRKLHTSPRGIVITMLQHLIRQDVAGLS